MRQPWRWLAAALLCLAPALADAQAPGTPRRPPPTERPQVREQPAQRAQDAQGRALGDTTRRAAGDSARAEKPLIAWIPDDSMMVALLRRQGYRVVRFQADTVGFVAESRTMTLATSDSSKAGVERDATMLVARRIIYNDSTKMMLARGDTIVMRDPARGEDVIGLQEMSYDVERREGRTRDLSTVASSGADWRVMAHRATFATDTASERNTLYGRDGIITSCLDSLPHYHFQARELKRVSNSVIVARPAILYVQDVPVMWLPFIFQDIRTGRRSGILTPRVGVSEVVRNSPTYRRTVEDFGYYFAISDYMDATVRMDWRSSARATEGDPGWLGVEAGFNYRWLDRFLSGGVGVSQRSLSSGNRNTAVSWSHQQEFSSRTRFTANLNYVTSTTIQRQTTLNPAVALATIASQANLVRQQGPFTINLGGTQRQYPGRAQIDRSFPSLNVASRPLTVGEWLVVTPTLAFSGNDQLNLDAVGDFSWRYVQTPGGLDSTRLRRNSGTRSVSLGLPFKVWDFQVAADVRANEVANDFPEIKTVPDPMNPGQFIDRVYARTYLTTADFNLNAQLPQFFKGSWNLAPQVSLSNVDPVGSFVRSERTNGAWVSQSKRFNYGAGVSPTFFALAPGFGRVQRFRHAVTPTFGWSYSPAMAVNPEFLAALGKSPQGYLGGLTQNRLTLGINTNLEAKLRAPDDTTDAGQKVRVASLQFTPLVYDFELARVTGRPGLATDRFGYTFRSDLLPGFDLGVDYSLFLGSVLSDTAEFKPYREAVRFGFELNGQSAIVRGISRLFGGVGEAPVDDAGEDRPAGRSADALGGGIVSSADPQQQGLGAVAGSRTRSPIQAIDTKGFRANFSVSQQRTRPPRGGRVLDFDPARECQSFIGLPIYEFCLAQAELGRPTDPNQNRGTEGGTAIRYPPRTNIALQTSFNLTPKWAAAWSTSYDVERGDFANQTVTLQRELHDWRAVFGFNRIPTGAFSFTFFISLKAQPEIKLPYESRSFRAPPSGSLR
ncbi:MAG: LPS-assembly protein LptD [Gemmatimonadaceae bacterium]|nr:LPS-assembly protein LptD [Gemmatimonadaceae bacterium]MCW5825451.1 LPS-assembly protein LptD [Gemmatimonadaceae bacterium]